MNKKTAQATGNLLTHVLVRHQVITRSHILSPAILCLAALLAFQALAQTRDDVASRCQQLVREANTIQDLSTSREALLAVRRCIDYGVDPPLRLRPNYGRSGQGASTTARSQLPSRTCPPFATCHYGARIATTASGSMNPVSEGQSFRDQGYGTAYTAPQFVNMLPASQMPEHLANGGTIYFYGDVCPKPPSTSLVVPNFGLNRYADGDYQCMSGGGHIMVPEAPNGEVIEQEPVTLDRNTKLNWDDAGIVVFPDGFSGTINGINVTGGEPILLYHSDDFYAPAGTKLYTMPGNWNPDGEHSPPIEYPPYDGPEPNLPPGTLVLESGPPDTQWW